MEMAGASLDAAPSRAEVKMRVSNQQVVPTILKALGLDPDALDAVRAEGIPVLPFFFED